MDATRASINLATMRLFDKSDNEDCATTTSSSTSSSCDFDSPCRLQALKAKLKSLLTTHGGSTKHPEVVKTIEELSKMNPANGKGDVVNSPYFLGDFVALTSPNFPGRIDPPNGEEDLVQYSLGRLSFNIFQPKKLVCTLRSVRNPVETQEKPTDDEAKQKYSYPLVMDITIHTPEHGDLSATLVNDATCYAHGEKPGRIMVSFKGASLKPSEEVARNPELLKRWMNTFEGAYKKAEDERSYIGHVGQFALKMLLGLTLPTDQAKEGFHFDMKRSPVGYLEVLYLDEDLRITKGNRGTIVVVERAQES
jgi:hypothetical protein